MFMEQVIIKFTGSWRGYSKGEIAGFPSDVAESLIEGGRAEVHDAKKVGKAASKPKSTPAPATAPQPGPGAEGGGAADQNDGGNPDDDDSKP